MKTEGRNAVIELLKTDKNIEKIMSQCCFFCGFTVQPDIPERFLFKVCRQRFLLAERP